MFEETERNAKDKKSQALYRTLFMVMTVLLILPVLIILGTLATRVARCCPSTSCLPRPPTA